MRPDYRVEAIALHEVGVFDDVRLEFPEIESLTGVQKAEVHIFTGPNGSGKSTLLYAIAEIFRDFHEQGLVRRRFRNPDSSVDFLFADQAGYFGVCKQGGLVANAMADARRFGPYEVIFSDLRSGVLFGYTHLSELVSYKRDVNAGSQDTLSQRRFPFAVFAYSGQRTLRDAPLEAIRQITSSPFEHALSFDGTARPQILLQWIANNRTQAALARAEGAVSEAESYDRALNRIAGLIRDVCDLDVTFSLQRSPLAVSVKVGGDDIHFDGLPDGLKSIVSWVGDLSLRLEAVPWQEEGDVFMQPVILLLDEIDIHLHPKWQRRILPAVQKLLPNAQIFVSTHSPFVVGSVEDAMVYRLPEPGARSGTQVVEGVPSSAGKSYRLILEEVFGIDGEFDVETESLFADFYLLRDQYMKSPNDAAPLLELGGKLAARGDELAQIVERELRQVSRVTGREIRLA